MMTIHVQAFHEAPARNMAAMTFATAYRRPSAKLGQWVLLGSCSSLTRSAVIAFKAVVRPTSRPCLQPSTYSGRARTSGGWEDLVHGVFLQAGGSLGPVTYSQSDRGL
jgi:hypothetical protein